MRHVSIKEIAAFAICVVALVSCGGSSKPVAVNVSPLSATLNPGGTQQFTANVSGGHNSSVNWNVNGTPGGSPTLGTVSSTGLYTAPSSISGTLTANVQAVSTQDSSKTATAVVKVVPKATASINRAVEPFPIELGTSGGNAKDENSKFCCSGTLGSVVNRGGSNYILSANHAIARSGAASASDPIIQPGLVDINCTASKAHTVATFSQAAPLKTSNVDAALALVAPGAVDTAGGILEFGAGGGVGVPATDVVAPSIGMPVAKSGRSTGLTCSSVSSVNTTVKVDYQPSCNSGTKFTVTFTNQIVINGASFSASGDSGALIVNSQTAQPVGLLYAGSDVDTVANPMSDVLKALSDPSTGQVPVMVGGAQHSIACTSAAQATGAPIENAEVARATSIKQRNESALGKIPGVVGLGVTSSGDEPGKAAISIYVSSQTPSRRIPQQVEGIRTRVQRTERFSASAASSQNETVISGDALKEAAAAKQSHEREILIQTSVLGLGIARSEDDTSQPAVVIFVDKHQPPPLLPNSLNGVRTRIVAGERFRAFGWNEKIAPACSNPGREPKVTRSGSFPGIPK